MSADLKTSLRLLRGQSINEMLLQEYPSGGFVAVLLKFMTGRTFEVRGTEIADAPFGAYTLSCVACAGNRDAELGGPLPWRFERSDILVDDVTIVEREEWIADGTTPGSPMLASNQTLIDAGPLGSAPSLAVKVTVPCGIVLRTATQDEAILLYLYDFPGLLGISTDKTEIGDFTRRFTEVRIAT
jgi:hypothetical protein